MNARHDASYKHLFSSPKVVRHLVEGFIPDEEIKRLDFSTLERMNASYVSEDLRERLKGLRAIEVAPSTSRAPVDTKVQAAQPNQ